MRLALAYQRFVENDVVNQAGRMPRTLATSARDALVWATVNGADACGLEAVTGSLRPGKQADVIVVGGDGFGVRPRHDAAGSMVFQASPRDVRAVLVAGRIVKRDGALVGVDLPRVLDRADASAARIRERVRATTPVLPPRGAQIDLEAMARHHLAGAMRTEDAR
jgi:cytosine/adenosine deaminase-related metal-dependent hydrolase